MVRNTSPKVQCEVNRAWTEGSEINEKDHRKRKGREARREGEGMSEMITRAKTMGKS